MKIGDTYYEKHTVVGISKRTNTVSETDVEIVNVLPIDVLDKIRAEIQATIDEERAGNGNINKGVVIGLQMALDTINKHKAESEDT